MNTDEIITIVAEDGLPEPRDLDVAVDAILCNEGLVNDISEDDYTDLADLVEYLPNCENNPAALEAQRALIHELLENAKA